MNRVVPAQGGKRGEPWPSVSQTIAASGSSEKLFEKSHPDQSLDYCSVAFALQEMKAHVKAHGPHVVSVTDVKLFIFKP
jgi:hypothetical protein